MKKIKLGNTGLSVSPVGFGVLTVGATQLNMPVEQGAGLIKYALSKGINFFDTAQYYETYPYLRMGLENTDISRSNPDRPVICSKCLGSTYNDMEYAINEALREQVRRKLWLVLRAYRLSFSMLRLRSEWKPTR